MSLFRRALNGFYNSKLLSVYGGWMMSKLTLPNWMAYYRNEWITFKLNGSQLNGVLAKWMDHSRIEWLTVEWRITELNGSPYWMAYHRIEWITVLNGLSPNWMDHRIEWRITVLNGSPYWMAYHRIEWITVWSNLVSLFKMCVIVNFIFLMFTSSWINTE